MKRTMDYVIGVDIGTQSTKALLVGADGRIVATESQGYPSLKHVMHGLQESAA
jgi:ribulokinase